MDYIKKDLPNGIRLRAARIPQSPTVTFAVLVGAGSRNESPELSGIAHFIEHNVFKGTPSLPSAQAISTALDSLGASFNAFTSYEFTGYYAKAAAGKLPEISKIISDIFLNPLFPRKDLDVERGNVIEEINMYEDVPRDKVADAFFSTAFPNHPLGRKILGSKENLNRFTREDLISYRSQFYDPHKVLVVAAGNFDTEAFFSQTTETFSSFDLGKNYEKPAPFWNSQESPFVSLVPRKSDQTHLILGYRALATDDRRLPVLAVANEILGGGMSSRLFDVIRNKLGLAYYIGSDVESFNGTGLWITVAGVTNEKYLEALQAILKEWEKFLAEVVTAEELHKAKERLKGELAFSIETSSGLMRYYGLTELTQEKFETPEEKMAKIDAVTAEEVQDLAQELVNKNKLTVAVLGPFNENEEKEKIAELVRS